MKSHPDDERLQVAHRLIKQKQYDRARLLLQDIGEHPTAKAWLAKLDEIDPEPTNFEEAKIELEEARTELKQADEDLEEAQEETEATRRSVRRGFRLSTALLIFLGTLLGSSLGAVADFGEALQTVEQIEERFYPQLCILGSDTILGAELGVSQEWVERFREDHQVRVKVDAIGSGNGVEAAANGDCAHILAMSEPIQDHQLDLLAQNQVDITCAAEVGYDIIVFITDINNPVTIAENRILRRILTGDEPSWSALSSAYERSVTILARPGSGTTDLVLRNVARWDIAEEGAEFPPQANYLTCESNEECLNQTLSTRGGLYWASGAWMRTQPPRYLRVLSMLQGDDISVNPLESEVRLDSYPAMLQRPLYMYVLNSHQVSDDEEQLAQDFLRFVRGLEGQAILDEGGFYTYFNQPEAVDVPLPPGFDPLGTPGRQICLGD